MRVQRKVHITNPTNIIKIPQQAVKIKLDDSIVDDLKFQIVEIHEIKEIKVSKKKVIKLPEGAAITIGAQSGNTSMSFNCGTVGNCEPPDGLITLDEIDPRMPITFRIFVWDKESKKILASNDIAAARIKYPASGCRPFRVPVKAARSILQSFAEFYSGSAA